MNTGEWTEFDILSARLNELQRRREEAPKGRVGWLRELDAQILVVERQRDQLLAHLTRNLGHRVTA